MSCWLTIPSIRPGGGTIPEWRRAGYRVAIVRQGPSIPEADIEIPTDHYLGWSKSINMAVRAAMEADPEAQWFIGGGDDTLPDPNHSPEDISAECSAHFRHHHWRIVELQSSHYSGPELNARATLGVMQPIGDLKLWPNSAIDKFAGSPWMGRTFCRRANGGRGPLDERFHHMFGDEVLQRVAEKLGIFWQRPDLIHKHMHALRNGGAVPDFLKPVNTKEHWEASKAIFKRLEAGGFAEAFDLLAEASWEEEILKA